MREEGGVGGREGGRGGEGRGGTGDLSTKTWDYQTLKMGATPKNEKYTTKN